LHHLRGVGEIAERRSFTAGALERRESLLPRFYNLRKDPLEIARQRQIADR